MTSRSDAVNPDVFGRAAEAMGVALSLAVGECTCTDNRSRECRWHQGNGVLEPASVMVIARAIHAARAEVLDTAAQSIRVRAHDTIRADVVGAWLEDAAIAEHEAADA